MKKPYKIPDIEVLAFATTSCLPKEILSSTGELIGYEKETPSYTIPCCGSKTSSSNNKSKQHSWFSGWFFWPFW